MKKLLLALTILSMLFVGCGGATDRPQAPRILTVMTHDSFAVSEDVIEKFQVDHNVTVRILKSGDAGTAITNAIINREMPLADVFFGIDNTLLTRGLDADIFTKYDSPVLAEIPDHFKLDPKNRVLPVNYGDVCLNYDKAYFNDNKLLLPDSLEDLTKAKYEGLLVVENPASSSPGLAFLLATVGHFGTNGYIDYWADLRANGVKVVEDWETAYYTEFSGSSGRGSKPLVVSYASSPPAEVIYAEERMDQAPTGSIVSPDMCFRQVEFVGILRGTPRRDLAEDWIDFMLSTSFQEDMPMQMFVFPVNPLAELPAEFIRYAQLADQPAFVDPSDIAANREEWIKAWTATVLR